jgi:hypothetical protein
MGQVVADASMSLDGCSAEHWRTWVDGPGAWVAGCTTFDFTRGWDGESSTPSPEGHG